MSINIDKEDMRKALGFNLFNRSLPLMALLSGSSTVTYDGEYLIITNASGEYSAVGTGYGSPAYQATRDSYALLVAARCICVSSDNNVYIFFLEPRKANYDNYQGFRHDGSNHCFEFRKGGAEEQINISGQDWTVEREFKIKHQKNQTNVQGWIDGVLKATCADPATYASAQPYCIYACEPNGVARTCKLKFPDGIYFWAG